MVPIYSVIVPTYGRPSMVARAVESVLTQSEPNLEVIVVDDGGGRVPRFRDPRVRVVTLDVNVGAAAARNEGVTRACGQVLAFLDDDDCWSEDRLDLGIRALRNAPVAVCWQGRRGRFLEGDVRHTILNATTPSLGATLLRRDAWIPLPEGYRTCEDLWWWLEVSHRWTVSTSPSQGLHVGRHSGDRGRSGAPQRIVDSLRLMEEYRDYFDRHPAARSFRWKRIALMHESLGSRDEALDAIAVAWDAHRDPALVRHRMRITLSRPRR